LRTVKNIHIGDSSKMFSKNLSTHTQIVNISHHHAPWSLPISFFLLPPADEEPKHYDLTPEYFFLPFATRCTKQSCVLPIYKKIYRVKTNSSATVWYNSLAKSWSSLHH
jgi:hypothetical protein